MTLGPTFDKEGRFVSYGLLDERNKRTSYNYEAFKKVVRYARWQFLQRLFWHFSARKKYAIPNFVKKNWYYALHDKP